MTVRVPLPDLSVSAMDKKLLAFPLGSLPCGINGGRLGVMMGGIALRTFLANRPLAVSWNNMNVLFHKQSSAKLILQPDDLFLSIKSRGVLQEGLNLA